jgi:hypothetical protein
LTNQITWAMLMRYVESEGSAIIGCVSCDLSGVPSAPCSR